MEEHALAKLKRKNLDLIAANEVGDDKVFEQEDNALTLFWPEGGKLELGAARQDGAGRQADGLHRRAISRTRRRALDLRACSN